VNLSELKSARATAGARYAAALAELRESLVDLAALDAALANKNVNPGFLEHATYGLPKIPPHLAAFEHREFAPNLGANLHDQIRASLTTYLAGFTQ
jgi:hypothetical protein